MTIESEVYTRLSGFTGLTALISTRIYPTILPQESALPAISYQVISGLRNANFGADTGDVTHRIQVNCYADKAGGYAACIAIKEQVRAALERYAGGNIQDVYVEGESRGYEPEAKIFTAMIDFLIWFKES